MKRWSIREFEWFRRSVSETADKDDKRTIYIDRRMMASRRSWTLKTRRRRRRINQSGGASRAAYVRAKGTATNVQFIRSQIVVAATVRTSDRDRCRYDALATRLFPLQHWTLGRPVTDSITAHISINLSNTSSIARHRSSFRLPFYKKCLIVILKKHVVKYNFYHPGTQRDNAFGRICLHVRLSVRNDSNFWKLWPWYIFRTSGQVRISRSSGQGQGHRSKKTWNLTCHPFCDRHGAVSVQMQWRQVHFSRSRYDDTYLQQRGAPRRACADFKFPIRRHSVPVCSIRGWSAFDWKAIVLITFWQKSI